MKKCLLSWFQFGLCSLESWSVGRAQHQHPTGSDGREAQVTMLVSARCHRHQLREGRTAHYKAGTALANRGPSGQGCGLSSGRVWM